MDDKMEELCALLHEAFTPLDFSSIHGFPNGCYKRVLRIVPELFGNDEDSAIHHVVSFCKLMEDLKVYHEDDLMIVFALTLEGHAVNWFYGLLDEAIDSVAKFFEKFLLRWHEGTVDEIEQLAKEYDALLPGAHPESKQ